MSRFWPHTAYAEDQPYAHTILYTHVLTRALQTGSVVGTGAGASIYLLRHYRFLTPKAMALPSTMLRGTGIGAVISTGLLAVGLPMMMRSKQEIEWLDRSWRLLENKGQIECDDWTYAGMGAGLATVVARRGVEGLRWKSIAGGIGAGSVAGMIGYMGWRYGVKGGKREESSL